MAYVREAAQVEFLPTCFNLNLDSSDEDVSDSNESSESDTDASSDSDKKKKKGKKLSKKLEDAARLQHLNEEAARSYSWYQQEQHPPHQRQTGMLHHSDGVEPGGPI
ncbi:hypothetical protein FRB94_002208 [Tulasnella sp. JGI-2019a]|nr:hypothetical protein FRB93_012611 [Tulasnella sp. JGI-2019a]KAG8987112.1 hypothetical protein FRB94_002208 [Tulasnella sp. JGI-2019a]KAG9021987.1 hypothetical protein FRB95_001046 [Tulasnella sp. JGI-2019a]